MFVEGDSPVGPLPMIRFPLASREGMQVPALGEHTDEILAELGYRREEVDELRAEEVV
jgi:crotonobetainyl-CoA:carnitine CoA-transferase CaiB-like acyl-CoA transferase